MISMLPALVLAATLAGSAPGAKPGPSLALGDLSPVVVTGHKFQRRERVNLRTRIRGRLYTKAVIANRLGAFTTRLAPVDAQCVPFVVGAVGARGSKAVLSRRVTEPCGVVLPP